jgi:hypothetical protein
MLLNIAMRSSIVQTPQKETPAATKYQSMQQRNKMPAAQKQLNTAPAYRNEEGTCDNDATQMPAATVYKTKAPAVSKQKTHQRKRIEQDERLRLRSNECICGTENKSCCTDAKKDARI